MEQRIRRLESTVRILAALVVLIPLFLLIWMGGNKPGDMDPYRVPGLQLVDAEGRVRIKMSLEEGGPALRLFDEEGTARASLEHGEDGTALYIMDGQGTTRLGAAQFAHGGGGFALHGPNARGAAVLYLEGDGSLRFFDEEGDVTAQFPPEEEP